MPASQSGGFSPASPTIQGRVIAFVDAGFLIAEGRKALKRSTGRNDERHVDASALVNYLRGDLAGHIAGGVPETTWDFVRAYWYDGAYDPTHPQASSQRKYHETIASVPGIQLRLGHLKLSTPPWQHAVLKAVLNCGVSKATFAQYFTFQPELRQKGVDTRLVLDLVRGAQVRAFDDAIVISGDDDLAEAVQAAQDLGRRITLAHPPGAGVANTLKHLVDGKIEIPLDQLERILPVK